MFGFAAGVFVEYDSLLVSSKLEFDQEKKTQNPGYIETV